MDQNERHPASRRLFIAVPLPGALKEQLKQLSEGLPQSMRFASRTHREDYHITLQFLGDTAESAIPALVAAMREVAAESGPFVLSLDGLGSFGQDDAPRVLWAGISGERDELSRLQRRVTEATAPLGFIAEKRPYAPHITLARKFRGVRPLEEGAVAAAGDALAPSEWTADRIVIYETQMHSKPMYKAVAELEFGRLPG
ncbi:RNA 2',3'-cyclic phosphodiesterase [Paenibacillus sp. NFR01]|uniref:RNA 2',3'-cyclic phosphodiesterase n=1 Tax=Paenibacillus sp. NFR01 TaxID=1566279 RepID=UPI0008BFC8F3|nr:RNA 2',3'-cyclic phosphodiesterase [Paenibacillus sp. NFR01]SET99047.1 2'-5' RNA ligase [Paenibacillus sp. NFR01]